MYILHDTTVYQEAYKSIYDLDKVYRFMIADCPIRIKCSTKEALRELSIIRDAEDKPIEPYDSITLKVQQHPKKIDVSKI